MSWKLARPRLGLRAGVLLLALAGLLACSFIPIPRGNTADPVSQQIGALRTGSAAERSAAATELARLAGKDTAGVVPALTQALQDNDPGVRLSAVSALHVVTPDTPQAREAAAALIATLRDADPRVRAQAAGILSTLKPDPKLALPQLISAASPEADAPAAGSTSAAPAAGSVTARDLIDRSQRGHARASAVTALGVLGAHDPEVQRTLVALADDAVPEVRMVVARVLGEIGPETAGAFAAERKLTSDPDLYIQARAITALGNFPGDHVASCPLLYRAYLSKQRPLQEGAELSLEKIIKSKQFNASAARQGKDAALRFAATFGLNPNSDAGFQALVQTLKDDDPGVRIMAASKLARVSSSRTDVAFKALESLADDKDADVRDQMHRSLAGLTPKPSRPSGQ
jgi:HEAT repeat protein